MGVSCIVEDYKGRLYEVHAMSDCGSNKGGLWCTVYRGIGDKPFAENMVYEEYYSGDFCIHKEDCDCTNENAVENYIRKVFKDKNYFNDFIYSEEWLENNPVII